jgi:hypothetical protein
MFWLTPTIRGLKGALRVQAFCLHGVRKKEGGQRCRHFQAGGAGSSLATPVRAILIASTTLALNLPDNSAAYSRTFHIAPPTE